MKLKRQLFRPGRRIEQIERLATHPFFTRSRITQFEASRSRFVNQTRPRLLATVAENAGALFSILISVVLIVGIAALLVAFVREVRRDEMALAAFTTPRDLLDRGYNSGVIAEHIPLERLAIR